jgi:hypothetical protein
MHEIAMVRATALFRLHHTCPRAQVPPTPSPAACGGVIAACCGRDRLSFKYAPVPHCGTLSTLMALNVRLVLVVMANSPQDFVDAITGCVPPGRWFDFGDNATYNASTNLYGLEGAPTFAELMKMYTPNARNLRKSEQHPTLHFASHDRCHGHMWVQHGDLFAVGTPQDALSVEVVKSP